MKYHVLGHFFHKGDRMTDPCLGKNESLTQHLLQALKFLVSQQFTMQELTFMVSQKKKCAENQHY